MSLQLILIIVFIVIMIFLSYAMHYSNQRDMNKMIKHFDNNMNDLRATTSRFEMVVNYMEAEIARYEESKDEVSCPLTYDELLEEENSIK